MNGLWLEQGQLHIRSDLPMPQPGPGEALVRVRLAGICATDRQLLQGYSPFTGIPGHEFIGVRMTENGVAGQRVAGEINIGCGHCAWCCAQTPEHCAQRQVLGIRGRHGAFAEYVTLPIVNLHTVPDNVPDEAAVFTEPLAAALRIVQQLVISPSHEVLVLGAGALGQLIARVLRLTGCNLAVCARYPAQRQALTHAGITWLAEDQPLAGHYDCVIDATGAPDGLRQAMHWVKSRGTVVMKSTFTGETALPLAQLVVREIRLQGSRCGPFAPALRLLAQQLIFPQDLISTILPWHQGANVLAHPTPGNGKILLRFGAGATSPPSGATISSTLSKWNSI